MRVGRTEPGTSAGIGMNDMATTLIQSSDIDRPRQAVILAGGRGTRLAPLTDTRPKPMIKFHGRPFLEYLIEFLRERGFVRVLLLLGYLPEVVRDHFGDGSRFGVEITYSVTDVDNDTGRRLYLARQLIEPCFLLAYCDNYCPVDTNAMWRRFRGSGASAMVTVYANHDGYTRDNIKLDAEGFVAVYDKARSAPDLKGVDIGFLLVRRDAVLDLLPDRNVSFEAVVYPQLVAGPCFWIGTACSIGARRGHTMCASGQNGSGCRACSTAFGASRTPGGAP
jgi:NDP-sugar pyrophosphorylase family protein